MNEETEETPTQLTDLIVHVPEPALPAVLPKAKAFVIGSGSLTEYMGKLMAEAERRVQQAYEEMAAAEDRVREVVDGLEAQRAIEIAEGMKGEGHAQVSLWKSQRHALSAKSLLARRKKALTRAQDFKRVLEAGYVPLPQLPAVKIDYCWEIMPLGILEIWEEAKESGLFEEFRVVDGTNADRHGRPLPRGQRRGKDPVLVGLAGGEMFALGWWRPTGVRR